MVCYLIGINVAEFRINIRNLKGRRLISIGNLIWSKDIGLTRIIVGLVFRHLMKMSLMKSGLLKTDSKKRTVGI
jgi:hypothetical protein